MCISFGSSLMDQNLAADIQGQQVSMQLHKQIFRVFVGIIHAWIIINDNELIHEEDVYMMLRMTGEKIVKIKICDCLDK